MTVRLPTDKFMDEASGPETNFFAAAFLFLLEFEILTELFGVSRSTIPNTEWPDRLEHADFQH